MVQKYHLTYKNIQTILPLLWMVMADGGKVIGDRYPGHKHAKEAVKEIVTGCLEQGISYLTLYVFSTENYSRSEQEVNTIFRVIAENINLFTEYNIKFHVMGDTKGIPGFCWNTLKKQ